MLVNWVSRLRFVRRRQRSATISPHQLHSLELMANGLQLKNHRYIDGAKANRIHSADGATVGTVSTRDIRQLERAGLITSNMKFPAATYSLTPSASNLLASHSGR